MVYHDWVVEEVDCGSLGTEDFWVCRGCGASGGLAYYLTTGLPPSIPHPFINEKIGGPLELPEDCEESIRLIQDYRAAKTVGVYGGSFNPVTWGHVASVVNFTIMNQILDEVVIVPCFQQRGKDLIDFHHRYKMCQMAFESISNVTVSDIEYQLGGESYSYRLVQSLKNQNPHWNLRFIMGADLKDHYKGWEKSEVIDRLAPPLIVPRLGFSSREDSSNSILLNISSTLVRKSIVAKKFSVLKRALPKPVFSYIMENNLYQEVK